MKSLFKKVLLIMTMVVSLTVLSTNNAKADITDSSWFEPVLGCVVGGGGTYLATQSNGNALLFAALGCGGGALIGILLNSHYSSKYGKVYQNDIADLRSNVKELQLQQALRAAHGDDDDYALRIKTVVPGQKLPDGSVSAPTIREKLVAPGENLKVGD